MVDTPAGPRPIESLVVGDVVWSVDVETSERVAAKVTAVRSAMRECLGLHVGATSLVCTPDHPVYDPDSAAYVPAGRWVERGGGNVLLGAATTISVTQVDTVDAYVGVRRVFDLTVDSSHHNFLAAGIVVHNKSPPIEDTESATGASGPTTTATGDSTASTDSATGGADTTSTSSSGDTNPTSTSSSSGEGTANTGTTAGSGSSSGGIFPAPADGGASIGSMCSDADPCPANYTCQGFSGDAFEESCQIRCDTCECPNNLGCSETSDKTDTWMQCTAL